MVAFSVRQRNKEYSRSAIDLSLEQKVNRDATSSMKGIVAFWNPDNAIRKSSLKMVQQAMAVTEVRAMAGLENGEFTANQQSR